MMETNVPPIWHQKAYSINAMRDMARATLPNSIFDFADGGADDETTLRQNAPTRDLSVELFGKRLNLPVIIGPTGLSGLFWPDGERETAKAAHAAGTAFCLSHGSTCTMEELATTDAAPRWMQVFIYKDRSFTQEFCHRAEAAGFVGPNHRQSNPKQTRTRFTQRFYDSPKFWTIWLYIDGDEI